MPEYREVGWVKVTSSNLEEVAYDAAERRLWVRFLNHTHTSGVGYYAGVDRAVYDALLAAPSKGVYHHAVLVKGGYTWVRQ